MKRIVRTLILLLAPSVAVAQGALSFNNTPSALGYEAPVYDMDEVTRLSGAEYLSRLYAGTDAESLSAVGAAEVFLTGIGAGFFRAGEPRIVPNLEAGQTALVEVRSWDAAGGRTYEEALANSAKTGKSNAFEVELADPVAGPPANLIGLESFALIPEPTPAWLVLLGLTGMWAARRRPEKRCE